MSPTSKENQKFVESVLPVHNVLADAVWWISNNLEPEDVFCADQLIDWAEEHGFVKERD